MNLCHAMIFAAVLGGAPGLWAQEESADQELQAALDRIAELERRLTVLEQARPQPVVAPETETKAVEDGWTGRHVVREGETLFSIARLHRTNAGELARRNGIGDANRIRTGQTVKVPGAAGPEQVPTVSAKEPAPVETGAVGSGQEETWHYYTVEQGDTWVSVADKFFTTPGQLASYNEVEPTLVLQVGQQLVVPTRRYHEEKKRRAGAG
jgi:LysM repeat protein